MEKYAFYPQQNMEYDREPPYFQQQCMSPSYSGSTIGCAIGHENGVYSFFLEIGYCTLVTYTTRVIIALHDKLRHLV